MELDEKPSSSKQNQNHQNEDVFILANRKSCKLWLKSKYESVKGASVEEQTMYNQYCASKKGPIYKKLFTDCIR